MHNGSGQQLKEVISDLTVDKIVAQLAQDLSLLAAGSTAESHFGQTDTLARDALARTLWPD